MIGGFLGVRIVLGEHRERMSAARASDRICIFSTFSGFRSFSSPGPAPPKWAYGSAPRWGRLHAALRDAPRVAEVEVKIFSLHSGPKV